MWFTKDAIDWTSNTNTFCCNNLPGLGNDLVATDYLDHMYRVLKLRCFGIGNVVLLRLTGLLSECNIQQRHQDCLMWLSTRGGKQVCVNDPPLSYVLVFENFMGQNLKAWFRMLTCWYPKVHHFQHNCPGRKFEYYRTYV